MMEQIAIRPINEELYLLQRPLNVVEIEDDAVNDILRGYSVVYNTHPVISRKSILRRLHNSRSRSLSTVESVSSQSSSSSDNFSLKDQERVFRLSSSTSDLSVELKHDENHGPAPTLLAPTPIRLTEIKTSCR